MRYVDTGSRGDHTQALGSWLAEVLLGPVPVAELRVQTGFFGSDTLGYFDQALEALAATDGPTRILVGSNDGQTPRAAVAELLELAGGPRSELRIGVVSFRTGFYHPKVFHFRRADGSVTAYVGSANLTRSGATSSHVEAGIILDQLQGDAPDVLASVADAADAWFRERRPGLYEVRTSEDLDPLVDAGVLAATALVRTAPRAGEDGRPGDGRHALRPLVAMPDVRAGSVGTGLDAATPGGPTDTTPTRPLEEDGGFSRGSVVQRWSKELSTADAQRRAGHQSAAVALTQGDYRGRIDHTTYFREVMFERAAWGVDQTTARRAVDVALVPMHVRVAGTDHGTLVLRVSHASHRESGTNSPTTYLHLEPLLTLFSQSDMTGRQVVVERFEDDTHALTIT